MSLGSRIAESCTHRSRLIAAITLAVALVIALGAALPSIWPRAFSALHSIEVDTDPENMLSSEEAARVFHRKMKRIFSLHDMVVVGVVDESHPDGVFNPAALNNIHDLADFAKTLTWEGEDGQSAGVVEVDLIAPSTVDNIEQGGLGTVRFEWLMDQPPRTPAEARAIRDKAERLPFLEGTLVSEDGRAIALYIPLTSKDLSYRVASALQEHIAGYQGSEKYYITGLPVAEDTFGVEMFVQMAISAPLAMLVIFLLMLWFFRKIALITAPMIVAMISVIITMGALIIAGHPVHIMSSMIPIFIMPIAVLDSIHIISEFFDRYQATRDRRRTIVKVMDELFGPMLYTSLTSAAGFGSLALTPIPPVQVFGIFVAMGILVAWVLTVTFIPAYVMFISEKTLANFGAEHREESEEHSSALGRFLVRLGEFTQRHAKAVLGFSVLAVGVAAWGITRIEINDNPVNWFHSGHPIRVADRVLNAHFGGSYMAYLTLGAEEQRWDGEAFSRRFEQRASERGTALKDELPGAPAVFAELATKAREIAPGQATRAEALAALAAFAKERLDAAEGTAADTWDEAGLFVDAERQRSQVFKDPEVLRYLAGLQRHLRESAAVGKSNSVADIVQTVHRELLLGKEEEYRIPATREAVAQCLITFQNSHRAGDLWHFVTPKYRRASIWVQLTSGDNKDMAAVVADVDRYIAQNPPPIPLEHEWFGLTYINVVWQNKMVLGMLGAFASSFAVVLVLMIVLFRSVLWGLLSMIPLTVTIAVIYGAVGIVGKAYDMPVAILSSLSLGLAVDFAIHLLARSRKAYRERGSWSATVAALSGEPARAISRNIIVIATGFLPLVFAPLVPYQTVGVLLAAILLVSGFATLLILPALMKLMERFLFPKSNRTEVRDA